MFKYLPVVASILAVVMFGGIAFLEKDKITKANRYEPIENNIGNFPRNSSCARPPQFLTQLKIPQPVVIDLSQKQFKGIAFKYGRNWEKVVHPKAWEAYEHFSTYAMTEQGDIFLAPTPFVSIKKTTFDLQKNIYKLDSQTGKISIFMHLDDVHPSPHNPYGINTLVYDCDDKTLWVAAIDETDYTTQRGVIYHIDIKTKTVLQKITGIDALTLRLLKGTKGKYLLVGAARENVLYAYKIRETQLLQKPEKLLTLNNANEYIRKIKVKGKNHIELQTIPFSYSLIAETSGKYRSLYDAKWNMASGRWNVVKIEE